MTTKRQLPAPPTKLCADPACDTTFTRGRDQSDHSWRRTLYCDPCGMKRSRGKPFGPTPRPEPTFRDAVPNWRNHAACLGEDPELFWPVGDSGPALFQILEAKTVCGRCPVVSECGTWAVESGQAEGVWGGMSAEERRALKPQAKRRNTRSRVRTAS